MSRLYYSAGTLRNVVCALHIGDADNLDNFIGEIDEVSNDFFQVFRCKKEDFLKNFGLDFRGKSMLILAECAPLFIPLFNESK